MSKHLRPAKKLIFRSRQLDAGSEFEFDKMQSANEIGQLEQPVARRPDGVCELHISPKKREWRDANPATHAESFPRIPVTPAIRKRSTSIVAHSQTARKGVL